VNDRGLSGADSLPRYAQSSVGFWRLVFGFLRRRQVERPKLSLDHFAESRTGSVDVLPVVLECVFANSDSALFPVRNERLGQAAVLDRLA